MNGMLENKEKLKIDTSRIIEREKNSIARKKTAKEWNYDFL